MRRLAFVFALAFTAVAGGVHAQQPAPRINVSIGPALQARAADFGPQELDYLRGELRDTVAHAFAHARSTPAEIDLVIESATPNRPTFAQLSRSIGLSMDSVGLGGARISGSIVGADGSVRPLQYQFYETDLHNEFGSAAWTDAERSFMYLAEDLSHGQTPDHYAGPGPQPHGGHFGYPYYGD